jgi:8-oxo-dGTP pyrophosphatase MutT (NUDIX family)|tara:strand:- start:14501 stop:14947 length:447 start_codon:yes stop_codon:yes gene_type:complete
MKTTYVTASGIIVFRNNNNNPEVLGLIALPKHRKRSKGRYDVPKGMIDEGETVIQSAFRECFEETHLEPRLISKVPITYGHLVLWLGEVMPDDKIILGKNPYTGKIEHEGYEWLSIKTLKNNCLNYLRPFIIDAEKIIWDYFNIWREK